MVVVKMPASKQFMAGNRARAGAVTSRSRQHHPSGSILRCGRCAAAWRTVWTGGTERPTGGYCRWTARWWKWPSLKLRRPNRRKFGSPYPARGQLRSQGRHLTDPGANARLAGRPERLLPARQPGCQARCTGRTFSRHETAPLSHGFRSPHQRHCLSTDVADVGHSIAHADERSSWTSLGEGETAAHAFPRPEDLAGLRPEALRPLGFSNQKSRAMIEAAQAVCDGQLDLESLVDVPDEEAMGQLVQLRGVGRWTAEYVLLRGLGRWHIFPGDDVGAHNNLTRWLKLREPLDYRRVRRVLSRWNSYGGLIYFHLLLDRLATARVFP